jgi:hypothetical protein
MNEPNGILASTNARLAALEERGAERVKEVAALKDENRRLADALADSEVQLAASQARVAEMDPTDGRTRCMKCHAVIVGSLDSIFPWWCSAKCRDACDIHRAHMLAVAERNAAREEARRLQQQFADSQAECERIIAHANGLQSSLETADEATTAMLNRAELAEQECERLRAALVAIDQSALNPLRFAWYSAEVVAVKRTAMNEAVQACESALGEQPFSHDTALAGASAPPVRDESVPPPGWYWAGVDGRYVCRGSGVMSPRSYKLAEAWACYDAEHGYAPRTQEPAPTCMYCDGKGRCPNGGLCVPCEGSGAETVLHAVLCEVSRVAESTDDAMDVTAELRGIVTRAIEGRALTQEPAPAASPSEPSSLVATLHTVARHHAERASHGGASWEFHARAQTACLDAAALLAAAAPSEPTRAQPQDEDAAVKWMEEMNECLGGFEKLHYDLQAERDASVRAQVESEIAAWMTECANAEQMVGQTYTAGALSDYRQRVLAGAYRKPAAEPTREFDDAVEGKPPAVPPLPDGWTERERPDGAMEYENGCSCVLVRIDGVVYVQSTLASSVHAVLSHHLARKAADQ